MRLDSLSLVALAIAFEKSVAEMSAACDRMAEVAERSAMIANGLRDIMAFDDPLAPPAELDIQRVLECKLSQIDLDKVEAILCENKTKDVGWSPERAIKLARKNKRRGRK